MNSNLTFDQAKDAAVGTVFIDRFDEGLRFVVLRGPCALCAYIGVPINHPLAGHSYDNLPVQVHGGLTYSGSDVVDGVTDTFWYGWDYGHFGDFSFYDRDKEFNDGAKRWTPEEVDKDSWSGMCDFRHLLKLSEVIACKVNMSKEAV